MGSSFVQLRDGAKAVGLVPYAVHADEKGLRAMPKPVLAHVERDHYVSVVKADEKGVAYVCSDCGRWPGGEIRVTWKQWRAMEADAYLALTKPGSREDRAYAALKAGKSVRTLGATASAGAQQGTAAASTAARDLLSAFSTNVTAFLPFPAFLFCGQKPDALHCSPCANACPMAAAGSGSGHGPSGGDPVNLATGEEEYAPASDLSVYNPTGPSLSWRRIYNSLGSYTSGFGAGWSHPYNLSVEFTQGITSEEPPLEGGAGYDTVSSTPPGGAPTALYGYVYFPNGSRVAFTASAVPTALVPQVPCTIPNGYPILMTADYHAASGTYAFTITHEDRTKWTTIPKPDAFPTGATSSYGAPPNARLAPIAKLADRVGNWISFSYGTYSTYNNGYNGSIKRLTGIYDSAGSPLLTLGLTSDGYITSANDRYNRSVYYSVGTYGTTNVPSDWQTSYRLLNQVSIIVPTGTVNPLVRYQYGYVQEGIQHVGETLPFLHTISVPSPTGTGMATTTINYDGNGYVLSIGDANGNKTELSDTSAGGANETTVKVKDPLGNLVWQQKKQFDAQMNETKLINGMGQTVWTKSYGSSQTPFRPTVITDGNNRTWQYTFDKFNRILTKQTPKGTVTTSTWDYTQFALGELIETKEGAKTSTQFDYDPTTGLLTEVREPIPGQSGTGNRQATTYTYNSVGNLVQVIMLGNNATAQRSLTFGYTTDGTYTQPECLGLPITMTDTSGAVKHLRYDVRGNLITSVNTGGETDTSQYNLADQQTNVALPATGQYGTLCATQAATFLYPGGPRVTRSVLNELGQTVRSISQTYGAEGELLSTSGTAEVGTFGYDARYQLKTATDGGSKTTTIDRDLAGRWTKVSHPGATGTNFDQLRVTSYDSVGNILQRTDGDGEISNYTYLDQDGLLSGVTYPNSPALNTALTYNSYGELLTRTDATGASSFTHDDGHRTTSTAITYTGLPTKTLTTSFFPDGSYHVLTTPGGNIERLYNADGRCTSVISPLGTASYTYSPDYRLTGKTLPNGATVTIARDPAGRTLAIENKTSGGTLLSSFSSASYNSASELSSFQASIPASTSLSGNVTYGYSALDQLNSEVSTRNGGSSQSFMYDTSGNPTNRNGVSQSFNSDNQRTGTGFAYDGNGNPTTYAGVSLTFDANNKATAFGAVLTAGYRSDGLRAWKQSSASRTYYLYDDERPTVELDANGNVTALNVFGADGIVGRRQGTTDTFYTFDLQGNVAQRLTSTQAIVNSSMYDAWGIETNVGTLTDPFGYNAKSGYVLDRETGLYLCGLRYYDPATGRFLNRDPISFFGGLNVYAYCQSQPTLRKDPSGLLSCASSSYTLQDLAGAVNFGNWRLPSPPSWWPQPEPEPQPAPIPPSPPGGIQPAEPTCSATYFEDGWEELKDEARRRYFPEKPTSQEECDDAYDDAMRWLSEQCDQGKLICPDTFEYMTLKRIIIDMYAECSRKAP